MRPAGLSPNEGIAGNKLAADGGAKPLPHIRRQSRNGPQWTLREGSFAFVIDARLVTGSGKLRFASPCEVLAETEAIAVAVFHFEVAAAVNLVANLARDLDAL